MDSNKSSGDRIAVEPQRRHGRQRVAELLKAGAEVFAEKGYEGATMAEIAERAGSPIGSLYRFFPGKDILANALILQYGDLMAAAFEKINARADASRISKTADALLDLLVDLRRETKAMSALLEGWSEWTAKRMKFRKAAVRHIAGTLTLIAPKLPEKAAGNIAVVVLHNMKMMSAFKKDDTVSAGVIEELRHMNRLYIADRLALYILG